MDFPSWIATRPRGELKRIEREARAGYTTLHRLMKGDRLDSFALAKRISEATEGAVTVEELCSSREAVDAT